MIDPALLATLLFLGGIFLLVAEIFVPGHGIVGAAGCLAILAAIGVCFLVNAWLGLGVLVAAAIASPFLGALFIKLYPHTFIGRNLILKPVDSPLQPPPVRVGQTGVAVSELKPLGLCD